MIISNRGLFRKLFRFYTLIISYIPKRGHLNVIISTKSLFIIISNSNVLKNLSKNISKLVFLDFQRKKKPKNWSPYRGGSRIFFLGGGALVSFSSSTPINHIVFFFWKITSCIRKPLVISGECAPLAPSPQIRPCLSALTKYLS